MPEETSIIRTNNDVITTRVNIEARDPPSSRLNNLNKFLALQVITTNHALSGNKEQRSRRVEVCSLS